MSTVNDNGVSREMTAKEQKEYDAWAVIALQEQAANTKAETATAAAKKSAYKKLAALGLTADEIAAL